MDAIHDDASPPVGALAFYDWDAYGHAGVSIGDGQVVSTQGSLDPRPVCQYGVTDIGLTLPQMGSGLLAGR